MIPFISIVIPLYNKAHYIQETITSVLNQTFSDFELIIVNDGSTDESLHIVNSISDQRIQVYSKENRGVSSARNYGILKANGTYIALLDADDFWSTTFLEEMTTLILKHSKNNIFSCAASIKTPKSTYNADYSIIPDEKESVLNYFKASQKHPIIHSSSIVFKKEIIQTVGLFDETLKTNEDLDFWIRIGINYKVVFINQPLITIQISENSLTKSNRTYYKSIDYSKYTKYFSETPCLAEYVNKNIYSSILKYKLIDDNKNSKKLKNQINYNILTLRQKVLIDTPNFLLKIMIWVHRTKNPRKNYY